MKEIDRAESDRRLLKLAKFLREEVPRDRFDYWTFAGPDWDGSSMTCGTKACALGWATTIPAFHRAGLRMELHPEYNSVRFTVEGKYMDPFEAGAVFFGLEGSESDYLFTPSGTPDDRPDLAAAKIEKFVSNRKANRRTLPWHDGFVNLLNSTE